MNLSWILLKSCITLFLALTIIGCTSQGRTNYPVANKFIAISIDDGPSKETEQLLKVLKDNNIKATFFLLGEFVQRYPEETRMIFNDGHEIGNHSYYLSGFGNNINDVPTVRKSIMDTQAEIIKTIGDAPFLFRSHIAHSNAIGSVINEMGMPYIGMNIYSRDWLEGITTREIINNVLNSASDGGIILLHEHHFGDTERTIKALPIIIQELRRRGYEVMSVTELAEKKESS